MRPSSNRAQTITRSAIRTWGWPLFLAVLSGAGLVSALVGDGAWDAASWVALAVPLVVCLWCGLRRHPR